MFFLETMSTAELTLPISAIPTATAGGLGMNALSGLGGYMTLGLASKAKALAVTVDEDVLIPRDGKEKEKGPLVPDSECSFYRQWCILCSRWKG